MIAKLKGLIEDVGENTAVIDVGGVGYLIFCSSRTLSSLNKGDAAELLIETHVREDHIHLYGFCDNFERDWFKLLTTVQGVGVKVALGMLGVLSPEQLLQAVSIQDKTLITKAPGVGPKLATRIISELKDKIGSIVTDARMSGVVQDGVATNSGNQASLADAVSALVNLGYQPGQALSAVSVAAKKINDVAEVEALISGGLKELATIKDKGGG